MTYWEIPASWQNVKGGISNTSDGILAWGRASDQVVSANRARFAERLAISRELVVTLEQVHGTRVVESSRSYAGAGFLDPKTRIPATDGHITSERGLVLMTSHADCAPIYFYLPAKQAIGMVHAGWRGTLAGIASEAVRTLCKTYNATPSEIEVAVGPMIATNTYEVGDDVAREFIDKFGPTVVAKLNGKSYLDVFAAIIVDLLGAGVGAARFCPRPPNTYSDPRWSSYRRDGVNAGGMLAYLVLL